MISTKLKFLLIVFLLSISSGQILAQVDNIMWSNATLKVPLAEKTSFSFKPIFRYNNDFSTFQNSSLDYNINRKLRNGFSLTVHGRTWFIPEGDRLRQFIWTDLNHSYKKNRFSLLNKLRYHWALDLKERADADFIRYLLKYSYKLSPQVKLSLGAEPWLRLNDVNSFQRVRYHAGISYAINSSLSLALNYWREENNKGLAGDKDFNVWLPGLIYTGSL